MYLELELVRRHDEELEFQRNWEFQLAQELVRENDELELGGDANCISSWSWCAGMIELELRIVSRWQEPVRPHDELELELERNISDLVGQRRNRIEIANCISCRSSNWREREFYRGINLLRAMMGLVALVYPMMVH